jgi:hypothetical protein
MSTISAGNTTTTAIKITGDTTGNLVFTTGGSNATALTLNNSQVAVFANSVNTPNTFGYKNRFINGAMQIAQRGTSATVTAGTGVPTASTGYPCVDRWFVYSTGANITAAQVAGSGSNKNNLQITGAASVTAVGIGQRIEQLNSYDMAGQTATLSVNISNSLLTTVTWTASYATTADTFGTIGTATKTQIATGTFTVNSTLTNYSTQISIPAAATTGIEILFTVGAQTSGTWVIGNAQLELGSGATSFDTRDFGRELLMCQRYYCTFPNGTNGGAIFITSTSDNYRRANLSWPAQMRTNPTVTPTFSGGSGAGGASDQYQAYVYINAGNTTSALNLNTLTAAAEL